MVIEHLESLSQILLGVLDGRFVLLHDAQDGEDPGACGRQDLHVGKAHPLLDQRLIGGVFAAAKTLVGHVVRDGVAFEQTQAAVVFIGWHLNSYEK